MKSTIYSISGEKLREVDMPSFFSVPVRKDLINRAFITERNGERQPYGASKEAGERHAVASWGVGRGVARLPRLTGSSRAAFAPQAVGGRRAHPAKPERIWSTKMNDKERSKAFCSAFAATARADVISLRGHKFDEKVSFPLIVENKFQELDRTKDVIKVLLTFGVYDDVLRAFNGRKRRKDGYKTPRSLLILASEGKPIFAGARNITGVDVRTPGTVRISDLAPGGTPGRLTIYCESTIEELRRLGK
jgi:large subunit ribosomal protein L4e